jgi:CBS-domain-containing membrane protein
VHAGDLVQPVAAVTPESSLLVAARVFASSGLPGIVVVDAQGCPLAVLPGSALVRLGVPQYVLDDPALAGVLDESSSELLRARMARLTVADALADEEPDPHPQVAATSSLVEVASTMANERVGLVVVTDDRNHVLGVVTAAALLAAVLPDG